tara:strand:- start:1233 stop:6701 length:5469 start_codon:yes stop_codon:yes gene_type:complete
MAKQVLELNNFAGGLNAYSDARDIKDLEFAQNWNAVVSKAGIIKVAGMALPEIETEYITNENFQDGRGLFQFTSDYSLSVMGSSFDVGLTSGTRAGSNSTTAHTLEDKQSLSSIDNFYQNMIMFITEGTGVGESRIITAFDKDTRVLTTEAFSVSLDTTSKYIIYSWKLDGTSWSGKDGDAKKDFITDGLSSSMLQNSLFQILHSLQNFNNKYFIFSKVVNITDEESKNLGYIEYAPNITLIPGTEYTLYFDCAAKQQFHNLISDGDVDPSDGATSHGDKLPWVQLYSTTVADTQGSIRGLANTQVTVGGGGVSSAWTDGTYTHQSPSSTLFGTGIGATFVIVVSASGATLDFHIQGRGSGYQDNDVLIFTNPLDSTKTASITVNEINITGLALYDNGTWKSGIAGNNQTSKYISYVDNNYIDNGDFKDFSSTDISGATNNGWVIGSNATAAREDELMYGGDIGTLSLKRSGGSINAPQNDSFSAYAYQSVQLDENTLYHLNFLYDVVLGQGLRFFIYNKTKEQFAPGFSPSFLPYTRSSLTPSNYKFPKEKQITFYTGNARLSSSTQKEEYYIGFAAASTDTTIASLNLPFSQNSLVERTYIRLAGVTLYKAHNDLASMSSSLNTDLESNPYKEGIKKFSTYSTKFTVPKNYTTVSDWKLRFYAGQFGFRDGNTFGLTRTQEVYFDNFILSEQTGVSNANIGNAITSDGPDTITAITNNRLDKSEIVLHSSKSNVLHKNMIQWNDTNCQPVFNYINGFLKISDGNFNNLNSNKLFYYTDKEGIRRDGMKGWVEQDNIFENVTVPIASQSFLNNNEVIFTPDINCIDALNELYDGQVSNVTTTNIAHQTTDDNKHAGAHAAWYGQDNVQGYVHMYYFNTHSTLTPNNIMKDNRQIMIPRFADANGNKNIFYENTLTDFVEKINNLQIQTAGIGGYENLIQNLYTGDVNNEAITAGLADTYSITTDDGDIKTTSDSVNYPRVNTFAVNRTQSDGSSYSDFEDFATDEAQSRTFVTNFVIPGGSEGVIANGLTPDINPTNLELEFEYEILGQYDEDAHIPKFKVDIYVIDEEVNTDLINQINIDRTGFEEILSHNYTHIEKTYGHHTGSNLSFNAQMFFELADGVFASPLHPDKAFINPAYETGEVTYHSFHRMSDDSSVFSCQIRIKDYIDLTLTNNSTIAISITNEPRTPEDHTVEIFYPEEGLIINPLRQNEQNQGFEGNTFIGTDAEGRDSSCAFFSRMKICELNLGGLKETDVSAENSQLLNNFDVSGGSFNIHFNFNTPSFGSSTSWGDRQYKLAVTTINRFNEESNFVFLEDIIGSPLTESEESINAIQIGTCPTVTITCERDMIENRYNKKINFYMKDTQSDIYYKQFFIDLETKKFHSTTSGITSTGILNSSTAKYQFTQSRENLLEFNEVNSYESETMVPQEDAMSAKTLTARYKCSVVANNRLYVGNIQQGSRIYSDRMLKSPIGKYNILPASSFIDVAINDGDEITALEYYKDKILQYKKRKVFVINVSGDFEFLEQTFDNVGVLQQCSVTKTPYGIVWANKSGCYLYDGETLTNLIENKIGIYATPGYSNNYWSIESNIPVIAYSQKDDMIFIKITSKTVSVTAIPDSYTYHFPTESWLFNHKAIHDTFEGSTGNISNMITNKDGDIIFYNGTHNGIKKLYYEPKVYYQGAETTTSGVSTKVFAFSTKEYTFGNIANNKKIYKIYVTYKTTNGNNSKVLVKTGINGAVAAAEDGTSISTSSKFSGTNTACYSHTNGLLDTGGDWKTAELKFTNPSNFSKINSLQLQFYSTTVDPGFEINDISISFRVKRVK